MTKLFAFEKMPRFNNVSLNLNFHHYNKVDIHTGESGVVPEGAELFAQNWWSASFNSQYLKECWINFQGAPRPGVSKESICSGRWCKCWPH
ncbi:hypothetical protein RDI58_003197 [Solanum bulbocastanum]|uniref:Uncharacterized protein n=1 Tax=Solanum bulbocastanum TaxID=147425 RepID=A0AAN8YUT0_SOLBU